MDDKNPQAMALGFKRARAKTLKIKELGITSEMSEDAVDELVKKLAELKAEAELGDWKKYVKGQRWYIEDLIEFSKLKGRERLDYEYKQAFPDTADEDEMLDALEHLMSDEEVTVEDTTAA